jgi:hypothetical protein
MSRRPRTHKEQPAKPSGKPRISDFFGILKREGQPTFTIEEINEVTARGWAGLDRDQED